MFPSIQPVVSEWHSIASVPHSIAIIYISAAGLDTVEYQTQLQILLQNIMAFSST